MPQSPGTFDPDHVLLYEQPSGEFPEEMTEITVDRVMEGSTVMQMAQYEEMDGKEKEFRYRATGPGAYWVGETERIRTSSATWVTATMVAKKLGVIIPVSEEFLHYSISDFFEEIQSDVAEAFHEKFDNAVLLGEDNPFPQSLQGTIEGTEQLITGPLSGDNILEVQDVLHAENHEPNAFISSRRNRRLLRNAHIEQGNNQIELLYDRANDTIDSLPVSNLKGLQQGNLYTGNFDFMRYGIPRNFRYKIADQATLRSIRNEDGSPIDLFEQEMVALRCTMDVGFMILKDEAFAKIQSDDYEAPSTDVDAGVQVTGNPEQVFVGDVPEDDDEEGVEA